MFYDFSASKGIPAPVTGIGPIDEARTLSAMMGYDFNACKIVGDKFIKTASLPTVPDQIGLGRGAHELLGIRLSNQAP